MDVYIYICVGPTVCKLQEMAFPCYSLGSCFILSVAVTYTNVVEVLIFKERH